jgi:hypothetical protein
MDHKTHRNERIKEGAVVNILNILLGGCLDFLPIVESQIHIQCKRQERPTVDCVRTSGIYLSQFTMHYAP